MRQCPQCSAELDDSVKVCPACGATFPDAEPEPESSAGKKSSWVCPNCQERVPHVFEVCWNCGTNQDGVRDPEFVREPPEEEPAPEPPSPWAPWPPERCEQCGSHDIILGLSVGGDPKCGLEVLLPEPSEDKPPVPERPGQLLADVCGACGFTQFRIVNPKAFYGEYLRIVE